MASLAAAGAPPRGADKEAYAPSDGSLESISSNPQSSSSAIAIPRRGVSPSPDDDKSGDRESDTFEHVMGSLDRSEEGVAGLTERISGIGFEMDMDATRFSIGDYTMGLGPDGVPSPARASEGMGSLMSMDDRDSFVAPRSSLSAFEGGDRESFAPARSSLDAVSGPRTSLHNPFAESERPSVGDAENDAGADAGASPGGLRLDEHVRPHRPIDRRRQVFERGRIGIEVGGNVHCNVCHALQTCSAHVLVVTVDLAAAAGANK